MQEINGDRQSDEDALADIIRAAGRRQRPPAEHYRQVYSAAHLVWQKRLTRRKRQRWFAVAATVATLTAGAVMWQSWLVRSSAPAAELLMAQGRVEVYEPRENRWMEIVGDGTGRLDVRPADAAGSSLANGTRLRTGDDGGIALRLAQGGSLRIRSDSEVTVSAESIELPAGTVYFDSAGRSAGRPIDIVTAHGRVRDIGTQFEVRALPASVRVRVRSGEIAVLDSPATQAVASQRGEEIELASDGEVSRRRFAPDDPAWAWAEALAVAPELSAPTVLAYLMWIAAETGKELRFVTESVRLQADLARFIGDPAGLTPSQLLATIAATSDFSYEMTDDGTIVIARDQ